MRRTNTHYRNSYILSGLKFSFLLAIVWIYLISNLGCSDDQGGHLGPGIDSMDVVIDTMAVDTMHVTIDTMETNPFEFLDEVLGSYSGTCYYEKKWLDQNLGFMAEYDTISNSKIFIKSFSTDSVNERLMLVHLEYENCGFLSIYDTYKEYISPDQDPILLTAPFFTRWDMKIEIFKNLKKVELTSIATNIGYGHTKNLGFYTKD